MSNPIEQLNLSPPYPTTYRLLNICRGLASLAVVMFHGGQVVMLGSMAGDAGTGWLRATQLGYLGVPVFFVVSGYCIAAAAMSAASRVDGGAVLFLYARARRIYPTYWAAGLMTVAAINVAVSLTAAGVLRESHLAVQPLPQGPLAWVANAALIQPLLAAPPLLVVSWTLSYEAAFYMVVACMLLVARWLSRPRVVLELSHGLTIACLVAMLGGVQLRFPLDLWSMFGVGVACFDWLTQRRTRGTATAFFGIGILFLAVPATRGGTIGLMAEPIVLSYPVAIACAALLVAVRRWDDCISSWPLIRPVGWVGLASYSLYLTHFLVLGLVSQAVRRQPVLTHNPSIQLSISVGMSIAFGLGFWAAFERPFRSRDRRPSNALLLPILIFGATAFQSTIVHQLGT